MKDTFGNRMKQYENVSQLYLTRRTPVIIRIDGKCFSNFTRGMNKPFDDDFANIMMLTVEDLMKNIQGAVFAYSQSDEISILLQDWQNIDTEAWFGNNIQKMTSISASLCTAFFNKHYQTYTTVDKEKMALFDARAFNIPKEEIVNYFIWRQKDAIRNSINSLGQSKFSSKELSEKNQEDVKKMLLDIHGIDWNQLPIRYQRGFCHSKNSTEIDAYPPIFTENRQYIEKTFTFEKTLIPSKWSTFNI